MTELDKKIKDLKDFIKQKTDKGTANYLGKEIREICGMVETEQLLIHSVSDIVHRAELEVLENVSDYIPCEIYSQAVIFSQKKRDNVR